MLASVAAALDLPSRFFMDQDALKGALPPELLATNYRAEITGFPVMDAAGHARFGRVFYAAFARLYHTIDEVRTTDRGYAVRFTLRGLHTAPFMGIPATGRPITVSAMVLLTVTSGRVEHLRAIFDQLGLLKQLGVVPA